MTNEERALNIAQELAYDALTRGGPRLEYAFRLGNQTLLLQMNIGPLPPKELENMYVSLNPPGENCGCCKGSGKQPATATAAVWPGRTAT